MGGKREKEDPLGRGENRSSHVMHGRRGGAGVGGVAGGCLGCRPAGINLGNSSEWIFFFFFLSVLATPEPLEVIRQVFLEQQKPSSWISQKGGGRD